MRAMTGHPRGVGRGARPPGRPPRPPSRWETSSTTRLARGHDSSHGAIAARPRSSRRRVAAAPSSEDGPSSTSTSPPARWGASRSSVATGRPRSPDRWTEETIRHSAAQPALPLARNVTRAPPPCCERQVADRPAPRRRTASGRARTCPGRRGPGCHVGGGGDREVDARAPAGCRPGGRRGRTSPRRRCRRGR